MEKRLTVIRAENASGKTTLLRAILWGIYGEQGLPGTPKSRFPIHPAGWKPSEEGIETKVRIVFETDGSSRNHQNEGSISTQYELIRSVTTRSKESHYPEEPDFHRFGEYQNLLMKQQDGWISHEYGIDRVIEELLPPTLRDFFIMDADEAADFVGGGENKVIKPDKVVEKTTFAVRSLLGLEIFEKATERLQKLVQEFGRKATHVASDKELSEKQSELDNLRKKMEEIKNRIASNSNENYKLAEDLKVEQEHLEALLGELGAYDELKRRFKDNEYHSDKAKVKLKNANSELSGKLVSISLLAALATQQVNRVRNLLQPLHDDGSIPIGHLHFVESLVEKGVCVCGRDLAPQTEHRQHVQQMIAQSRNQQVGADYLAQVLQSTKSLKRYEDGKEWEQHTQKLEKEVTELHDEINKLNLERREIDYKLANIDNEGVKSIRGSINMLTEKKQEIARKLVIDQDELDKKSEMSHQLVGQIGKIRQKQSNSRYYESCEETASTLVQILERSYSHIRNDQVRELSYEMNTLFAKMAENVIDDESMENNRQKATLKMIEKVGLREKSDNPGNYEIFALNNRGRSMAPTEINGASRRILALSFVLGLCRISRTFAPLIADSLLNFMSGSVRTNTLRITAETAIQPILLLTGSDLESQNEVDLVEKYAGATYTLTGQWQHTTQGGTVVNLTDNKQVSLICDCGPREFCTVCERLGQADNPAWTKQQH